MKLIHLLSALIWVGGMFFAYLMLRPAAVEILEPMQRLRLWNAVLRRFFRWVWISIGTLLLSGFYLIHLYGGMAHVTRSVHIMLILGITMILIYGHIFFASYRGLSRQVAAEQWPEAEKFLGTIRKLIALNLTLGLLTVCVAVLGATLK
ncbi:MAG: CopD family protein [Gallionella sp.]